ncbi:phage minor head protein [Lysinibacillus sp. SGAir0095]|uniref:phage minor head protein n=1 Tax=Lysinibacillus sp. SGAir0095 TaxID=2070463 RepID=UPI0010CD5D2A|nr:phage minor head protein [Lysinibacillus sp. SGAir0095]QCR33134.1 phage head morphogenesis protein [Lysinibacillus sp. SGAir0095]
MNELDIKAKIDKLLKKAESSLEKVFAKMLSETLSEMNRLFMKYTKNGKEPSWTDVNKYNRLHAILERVSQTMTGNYREVVKQLKTLQQDAYIQTYLQTAYLIEVFESKRMGFRLPSQEAIKAALENPIEFLRLPKTMKQHRDAIVQQIQQIITQSLIRGEGYFKMAKQIEERVGFFQKKARAVARTETGRAMAIADEQVLEQASKYVEVEKVWCSALDFRVRQSHRTLDGQKADKDGFFHYKSLKAKMPHGWNRADMDINCRCVTLKLVNGMLPTVRRGRNYKDKDYQERMEKKIHQYMKKGIKRNGKMEKLTYAEAFKEANRRIQPPTVTTPYITYEEWYKNATS